VALLDSSTLSSFTATISPSCLPLPNHGFHPVYEFGQSNPAKQTIHVLETQKSGPKKKKVSTANCLPLRNQHKGATPT
jgi:hypothetical protein